MEDSQWEVCICMRPLQVISEKEKTEKWCKDNADYLINLSCMEEYAHARDIECMRRYNNQRDPEDFAYLTKEFGIEYPVKIKFIPLIRPMINELLGEHLNKNRDFYAKAIDEESLQRKENKKTQLVFKQLLTNITNQVKLQLDGKLPQEQATNFLEESYIKSLEEKANRSFLDEQELEAQHVKNYLEFKHNLAKLDNEMFEKLFVTGKSFYKIEIPRVGADPIARVVDPQYLSYSADDNCFWLKDRSWVVERVYMTPEEILDTFADDLSTDDRDKLLRASELGIQHGISIFDGKDLSYEHYKNHYNYSYTGTTSSYKIEVCYVEWKSLRKLTIAELENKYDPSSSFWKLFQPEELEELPPSRKSKIKKVEHRYIQDLYGCIRIGADIHIRAGKVNKVLRSKNEPWKVNLSYNGALYKAFDGTTTSMVWETRQLEDLYTILHFHREKLIALSGVKGTVVDEVFRPEGMELHEWLYYKKMGMLLINSKNKDTTGYSLGNNYDDTLPASIEHIEIALQSIRAEAERILGVNPQRTGSIHQRDAVGNVEQALEISYNSTETLFYHQELVYKELLQDLVNATKLAWKNQDGEFHKMSSYILGDGSEQIFRVTDNFLLSDYGIFFTNSSIERKALQELKAVANSLASSGNLDFKQLIDVITLNNTTLIREKIEKGIEESQKQLQQLQQQQAQAASEAEKQKLQMEIQKEQTKLQEQRLIKELDIQFEKEKLAKETALKEKELEIKKEFDDQKIELEKVRVELESKQLDYSMQTGDMRKAEIRNS